VRSEDATCENCRHRFKDVCRRYPPVLVVLCDTTRWNFPEVRLSDWCGEFGGTVEYVNKKYVSVLRKENPPD